MSQESLEQFYQAVLQDQALQEQLKSATDQKSFVELAVELGEEKGYSFTQQEVEAAMAQRLAAARGESEELSDEQLEAVAGGKRASGTNIAIGC